MSYLREYRYIFLIFPFSFITKIPGKVNVTPFKDKQVTTRLWNNVKANEWDKRRRRCCMLMIFWCLLKMLWQIYFLLKKRLIDRQSENVKEDDIKWETAPSHDKTLLWAIKADSQTFILCSFHLQYFRLCQALMMFFFCSKRWWWRLNGPVTSREEEVSAIASIENPIKTEIKHRLSHPFPSIIFVFVSIRLSTIIANVHTHLFTIAVFFSEICRQLKFSFYEKSQK